MGLPLGAEENDRTFCCGALQLHPRQAASLVPPQPGMKATSATSAEGPHPKAARPEALPLEACCAGGPVRDGSPSLGSSLHESWT